MRIFTLLALVAVLSTCKQGHGKSSAVVNDDGDPPVLSGEYSELTLAYNPQNNLITGYFEDGTGDNGDGGSQFSCMFYIEGKLVNNKAQIKTYSPLDVFPQDNDDLITGNLTVSASNKIALSLKEEHGGCTMVQHFADEPQKLSLDKKQNWIEIRFIKTEKAFFYANNNEQTKKKAYLVKGNIIYIDKIEDSWLHCTFLNADNHDTQGWIKSKETNQP